MVFQLNVVIHNNMTDLNRSPSTMGQVPMRLQQLLLLQLACGAAAMSVKTSSSALIEPMVEAVHKALGFHAAGRERDGSWCEPGALEELSLKLSPVRGRKRAWWIDSPRPLRAVAASGARYDLSIVCLPGGLVLPPSAYPAGSVILCQPLCGQMECRRLRLEPNGRAPIELMRKTIKQGDRPFTLLGGCCHEWRGAPGVSSALLQLVLLPPTSSFPSTGGGIGWATPPAEGCESDANLADDRTIRADVEDLLQLEIPSGAELDWEKNLDEMPDDAPTLLKRLRGRVGGLDNQLSMIVRRTLSSRLYPPALTRELGLSPVKGMLLYGPPGCGKTLLAREISAALGAREPKIVNGPEMMNKYVGESESFVRALFAEAELEQMEAGDQSALHIIVLDELDAFCRERGALRGDTSGIRDSVVNQLLAKLDGVEELNNILVIGLTNRPELIDAALLRPGRLEVHVKVDLPDEAGRQTILGIHSRKLRQRGCFDAAALAAIGGGALAKSTFGYSGAQLAGLLRSATSFALERYTDAALLRGWVPGDAKQAERRASGRAAEGRHGKGVKLSGASAASEAGVDGGEGGLGDDGLLQVEFEDLARALRENAIEGSWQGRSKLALKVGAWRRQRLLRRYTQKLLE